jgi:arsenate reductase
MMATVSPPLPRRLLAELLGSAFLAALVIGSGIAAQTLSPGDVGLQLFENAAATAAGLFAIILMFGPISGGHFNPAVSLADARFGGINWRDALAYIPAQIAGCILGAITGRSQMSQALFERAAAGMHTALSAGTTPAEHVHPDVIEVMRELDIELSDRRPQLLTRELAEQADVVVTMGCGDECPYIPGKRYIDWDLPDPKGRPLAEVRATRDEIASRVSALLAELEH